MVISKNVYTTQSYCDSFLGFCPITNGNQDELREILDDNGKENLWDYPLNEVDHIIENNIDVVLVDTTYVNESSCELVSEYRWFQVPERSE